MNVANSEAFDNPRSTPTDRQFAAAKYASPTSPTTLARVRKTLVFCNFVSTTFYRCEFLLAA